MTTRPTPITGVRLDELIAAIGTSASDPLDQLSSAVLTADHIGDVADHLIGHFVDQARRSGASWTQIGASMGVTKQAAQKRFVAKPGAAPSAGAVGDGEPETTPLDPRQGFARFTVQARNVVAAAHNEGKAARSVQTLPEHLVLGLLSEPDGSAGQALAAVGADLDRLREAALGALPAAADDVPELLPYDERAKAVLEATFREAVRLGHQDVGTGHVLLALLAEDARGVFAASGLGTAAVEAAVDAAIEKDGAADPLDETA